MAAEATNEEDGQAKPKSSFIMNLVVSAVLAFVFGGLGYLTVAFFGNADQAAAGDPLPQEMTPAFIEFGEVVANVGEDRMTRFLRVKLTLQVNSDDQEKIAADVESRRAILRNWLLGYLSDLQLEDLRGTPGQNRIRRDTQNYFNDVLSPDGLDVIQDVLFEEYQLQ